METLTIEAAIARGKEQLPSTDTAQLDSEVLLAHVLDKPRSHLRTWPERALSVEQQRQFFDLIARRAAGEPVAYIIGHREFWSLDLSVNRHTLIPRPETELLVDLVLARIPIDSEKQIADLGTGSGAIALAIAAERPDCRIIATDISSEALATANANAQRLGLDNVIFRQGEWCAPLLDEHYDIILSNPPYVAEGDPHLLEGDLPSEPHHALVAGPDGLEMLAAIITQAPQHLHKQGWLLMEHGYNQAGAVTSLLRDMGFHQINTWRDVAGIDRVSGGQWA